jgi:hypothetical protein
MKLRTFKKLRAALFRFLLLFALGHDGAAKSCAEVIGEFIKLRVAVDLDRFLGGVADYVAVVAPREVIFEFGLGTGVEDAVEIIG